MKAGVLPLHHSAAWFIGGARSNSHLRNVLFDYLEPLRGIEPRLTDYKTVVLPLDDSGMEAKKGIEPLLPDYETGVLAARRLGHVIFIVPMELRLLLISE